MFLPMLPLCQLALGLFVFHLCLASMKMFRHSEASFFAYWKMEFLERLQMIIRAHPVDFHWYTPFWIAWMWVCIPCHPGWGGRMPSA